MLPTLVLIVLFRISRFPGLSNFGTCSIMDTSVKNNLIRLTRDLLGTVRFLQIGYETQEFVIQIRLCRIDLFRP